LLLSSQLHIEQFLNLLVSVAVFVVVVEVVVVAVVAVAVVVQHKVQRLS